MEEHSACNKNKPARLNQAFLLPREICLSERACAPWLYQSYQDKQALPVLCSSTQWRPGTHSPHPRNGKWALWISAVLTSPNHLELLHQLAKLTSTHDNGGALTPWRITRSVQGNWLKVCYTFSGYL